MKAVKAIKVKSLAPWEGRVEVVSVPVPGSGRAAAREEARGHVEARKNELDSAYKAGHKAGAELNMKNVRRTSFLRMIVSQARHVVLASIQSMDAGRQEQSRSLLRVLEFNLASTIENEDVRTDQIGKVGMEHNE